MTTDEDNASVPIVEDAEDADEELKLPTDTLALLQSFYVERDAATKTFEDLKHRAEQDASARDEAADNITIDAFTEDWQASQFWYDDHTSIILARALLANTTPTANIAVISAPSVYLSLRKILHDTPRDQRPSIHLLEFDTRFAVLPNFTPYDFKKPLAVPAEFAGKFDAVIVDPPFLSEDCQTKMAMTARRMVKSGGRVVVCTGAVMEGLVGSLYGGVGVRRRGFEVRHTKGLSNEFACFANFESEELG